MECDPTRVWELLVGLGDVEVLGVDDVGGPLRVHVRGRAPRPACERCGGPLWSDGERSVALVDLPAFGRPARLVWHKRRWRCPDRGCGAGTVTAGAARRRGPLRRGPRRPVPLKRPCAASMTSVTPKPAPRPWPNSPATSRTPACPQRSTGSAAPSGAGATRSRTGTPPGSPTPPPTPPTISSNGSNAPRSGTDFANYRIRALLYAGKPSWALLDTLTPSAKSRLWPLTCGNTDQHCPPVTANCPHGQIDSRDGATSAHSVTVSRWRAGTHERTRSVVRLRTPVSAQVR